MKTATKVVRIILGVMMLVFGLNGFLEFMPAPQVTQEMGTYLGALGATGYMFPLINLVETIGGALLLLNRFTTLALIALFTVMLNAFLAHLFLDPAGIGASALALLMIAFLFFCYRHKYLELIRRDQNIVS